jgi:hypothetical protein
LQERDGSRRLIAKANDGPHSAEYGVEFLAFNTLRGSPRISLNNQGKIAFPATYLEAQPADSTPSASGDTTSSDFTTSDGDDVGPPYRPYKQGIWTEHNGELNLVASVGDVLPGDDRPLLRINVLAMNDAGQVLLSGGLNEGSGADYQWGAWAQDRRGKLHLVAKVGQQIDIAPGEPIDMRTIEYYQIPYTEPSGGLTAGFNDLGQVLLDVKFTDGTYGILISNVVAIPEPGTFFLLLFWVVALCLFFRKPHGTRVSSLCRKYSSSRF